MKILVTGAAGFIGFHLVSALLKRGDEIIGIDNINDYYDVNLKYGRLGEHGISKNDIVYNIPIKSTTKANYTFIKIDISDRDTIKELFSSNKFDVVCNLAAQAGVRYSIENPQAYIDSNIVGFANILEGCRHNKVKHLVYASSSSVYGLNKKVPFSTTDNVDYPISLYAATKKSNELMAHTYSHLYNLPTTGLRFFTVYGSWGRPDMAYFLFTKAILEGKSIKVFNNGNMSRDFTYIDDIVEGIDKVINNPPVASDKAVSASKAPYKVYNIGNNAPVNLLKFIETIEEKLGMVADKKMLPIQPGDVYTTYADVSDLIQDLKYRPNTDLGKGIGLFVKWYKNFYSEK
ncbi:MAG: NAD-dependent epimerase [Saprospiraceae bacterium]